MKKTYECIGILPLAFTDKIPGSTETTTQNVEAGETFERDFAATSGEQHEMWLTQIGCIREVVPPAQVTKTPQGTAPVVSKTESNVVKNNRMVGVVVAPTTGAVAAPETDKE